MNTGLRFGTVLAVALAALTLAACGDDDNSSATKTAGATSSATASAATSATATTSSAPMVPPGGPVSSKAFDGGVSLTMPKGWRVGADGSNVFVVEEAPVTGDEPIAGLAFFRITGVFEPVSFNKEPVPADLISWLHDNADLEVLAQPTAVTVGGVTGMRIDVRGGQRGAPTKLLVIGDSDDFTLGPLDPARFTVVDVGGKLLVMVQATPDRVHFQQIVADMDAMMQSVQFKSP